MYGSATDVRSARDFDFAPAFAPHSTAGPAPTQGDDGSDPAGGIVLSGRNRIGERARAMAGLLLTTGAVVTLAQIDTTVSLHSL